jgi:hypothetical protein
MGSNWPSPWPQKVMTDQILVSEDVPPLVLVSTLSLSRDDVRLG